MIEKIIQGDCLEKLKELETNSIDSIVTDPPYELGFMGKSWDSTGIANDKNMWAECLRVLKPGGHLLSFGGTRTYHRMAVAIEDAGFEVRDMIEWIYSTGFPKSLNIGKAVDKVSERLNLFKPFAEHYEGQRKARGLTHNKICEIGKFYSEHNHGGASSNWSLGANVPTLEQWKILQPILNLSDEFLPLIERVEKERELVEKRVGKITKISLPVGEDYIKGEYEVTKGTSEWEGWGTALKPAHEPICMARKPLAEKTVAENVLKYGTGGINIDESRVEHNEPEVRTNRTKEYDGASWGKGKKPQDQSLASASPLGRFPANLIHDNSEEVRECFPNESERFFKSIIYQAKASKSDRGQGNNHPTVKPIALMEYLIKMVTPKGGIVLDPFAGSGSTLVAARRSGFQFIGIEKEEEYIPIIEARLKSVETQLLPE